MLNNHPKTRCPHFLRLFTELHIETDKKLSVLWYYHHISCTVILTNLWHTKRIRQQNWHMQCHSRYEQKINSAHIFESEFYSQVLTPVHFKLKFSTHSEKKRSALFKEKLYNSDHNPLRQIRQMPNHIQTFYGNWE